MTMRLIDADKIVFDYSGLCYIAQSDGIGITKYFADQIKSAPTITPESLVVHGRWIDKGSLSCRCSECGCKNGKETPYCPNCGAKMDLKE